MSRDGSSARGDRDPPEELLEATAVPAMPKRRACLRCGSRFESAWAGERICGRCKGSIAWRQGVPYSQLPPSRR